MDQQNGQQERDSVRPQESAALSTRRAGSRVPPLWVWLVIAIAAAAIAWIRIRNVTDDHAVVNVLTFICTFVAFAALSLWYLLFSGYRFLWRVLTLVVGFGGVVLLYNLVRIDHVTGELVPSFRWRWTPPRDQLLDVPPTEAKANGIDVVTTTPDDYPGFLGRERNLRVEHVSLDSDWSARPPRLVWKHAIGAGWSAFAVVNGYAYTLEQRGSQELVTCYAAKTGELLWARGVEARHETVLGGVGPRSTPTVHEGKVYTLGATGILRCLDGATGSTIWSDDLLKRYGVDPAQEQQAIGWGRAASPLVVDHLLVVPAGGPVGGPYVSLVAFEKSTGQVVWEAGDRQVSYSSPRLHHMLGIRQILMVNENNVTGHDVATGRVLWRHDWPGGSTTNASVSQAVPAGDDRILLSKGYGGGAELIQLATDGNGPWQVTSVWRDNGVLKTKFTNVVLFENHAFGLSDGILECVDLADGKRKWRRGRYGHGQILGVRELLLVQSETGELALVEANTKEYRELGRVPAIEGKSWNNLCLFGSLLLVRNAEEAACYELAVKPGPGPT
jgi:outer membrane protein assembly factor BamB